MIIRPAVEDDADALWRVLEPMLSSGETYALPRDMNHEEALAYWHSPGHSVFVAARAVGSAEVVGTYYLRANQRGGGDHVANCGFVTAAGAQGRGIARAMAHHALEEARRRGFLAMQFNFVVATNDRAVRLWESLGFEIVGRLPLAFRHPAYGLVDALVMHRTL